MRLYDHVDEHGANEFKRWSEGLETEERARLRSKLDTLKRVTDWRQLPQFLIGPLNPKEIFKLRIGVTKSKTALRPMACRGPIEKNAEVTLLFGAKEVGGKLVPGDATQQAEKRRLAIVVNVKRRCDHESVS